MRVVLDYRPALFGRGGIATYVRELACALPPAADRDEIHLWAHRWRDAGAAAPLPAPRGAVLHGGRRPSQLQTVLGRLGAGVDVQVGGADVVHATDYVLLPATRARLVATVHDVLFEELPDAYTAAMRSGLRATTRRLVRRAARIVVPSSRTRDALVAAYGADPGAVDVIPHGVAPLPDGPPAREHGRYLLFVGVLEPRKNVARLLEAHRQLLTRVGPVRLVVAGPRGWKDDAVVAALRGRREVVWEAGVDRRRLAALLRGAIALAYPSLGEGFGLPVLEAMSQGRPVLVGRDTTCSDLAGEAALVVDPRDVGQMAAALERLVEDPALCARLGEAGRRRSAGFTWEAAAAATWSTYRKAAAA